MNIAYSCVLLSVSLVLFNSVLVVQCFHKEESLNICMTEECTDDSEYILSSMNFSVDPCEDFYQFACGGWMKNNPIPQDMQKWGNIEILEGKITNQLIQLFSSGDTIFKGHDSSAVRKAKTLFKSCLDTEALNAKGQTQLIQLIDDIGSWTLTKTPGGFDKDTWTLQKALERTHVLWGNSFWEIGVDADPKDNTRNILSIAQGGLSYSHNLDAYSNDEFKAALLKSGVELGKLLGGDRKTLAAKVSKVVDLEKKLAKSFVKKEDLLNPLKIYHKMSLAEFQALIGRWINVEEYFAAVFGERILTAEDEINVLTPSYFKKLKDIISKTSKETLANYIVINFIGKSASYLPDEFSQFTLQKVAKYKRSTSEGRAEKCLEVVKSNMGFVTSALFVENHFSPESLVKMSTILDGLEHQFIQNVHLMDWIDLQTRQQLIHKARKMVNHVGFPDWILDPIKLDAEFEDLVIEDGELLHNYINYYKYMHEKVLKSYRDPPNRNKWAAFPHSVNAYYDSSINTIAVLAGILQTPIVSPTYPDSYLYGSIGTILGHELIHGFDNSGRLYDAEGHLEDTWTPKSVKKFETKTQCMIDQYSSYVIQDTTLNGVLTLGENIADNGGMKLAFRAFKDSINSEHSLPNVNLTKDQLFFLGTSQVWCAHYSPEYEIESITSDEHSHNAYRVIGMMSNSKDFSRAFNCPLGSPMNPKKKCNVW